MHFTLMCHVAVGACKVNWVCWEIMCYHHGNLADHKTCCCAATSHPVLIWKLPVLHCRLVSIHVCLLYTYIIHPNWEWGAEKMDATDRPQSDRTGRDNRSMFYVSNCVCLCVFVWTHESRQCVSHRYKKVFLPTWPTLWELRFKAWHKINIQTHTYTKALLAVSS